MWQIRQCGAAAAATGILEESARAADDLNGNGQLVCVTVCALCTLTFSSPEAIILRRPRTSYLQTGSC